MTTTAIAKALWFAGLVVWIAIRYPHQRKRPRLGFDRSVGGRQDRILLLIAALGQFIIPLVYVATGFPAGTDYPLAPVQGVLGAAALVASLILFRVTHKQLGQNWSVSLDTRQGHELVTDGLYAWVRHPMYSSFFLSAVAQLLLLPNWIAGPAGLIGIGLLFGFRVKREEQLMIETFGEAYRAYMRRTARIVPGVY
jgi:protein-S-isoprenylcysteine O-methyltransferase Ste14